MKWDKKYINEKKKEYGIKKRENEHEIRTEGKMNDDKKHVEHKTWYTLQIQNP